MKKIRHLFILNFMLVILAFSVIVVGCGKRKLKDTEAEYKIYCLDREENNLNSFTWISEEKDVIALADAMLDEMSKPSEDIQNREVIRGFSIENIGLIDNQLIIGVSHEYKEQAATVEVLVRGALVRTLCQIEGVDSVHMRCNGDDLKDALGFPVGAMDEKQFVDNAGNEINSYERVELSLYFSTKDGNSLSKVIRSTEYNSNISTEKLVVEQIIAGPMGNIDAKASVNPQTAIINVTVKDGICYVNLDNSFLSTPEGVAPTVTIYSLVNSLCELQDINKVQLSIDGKTSVNFENINLDTMFERNLDLVD